METSAGAVQLSCCPSDGTTTAAAPARTCVAPADFDKVLEQRVHDGLGGVGHEHAPPEVGVASDVGHGSAVVQVEVGDQHDVHLGQVDLVEEGQRGEAEEAGVHAAVEHHRLAAVLDDDAAAPDLLARAQRQDLQRARVGVCVWGGGG